MTCHECSEKLTAYMEGELSAEAEAQIVAHVDSCGDCRRELEGLRAVVEAVRRLPDVAPPPELRANISRAMSEHSAEQRPRALLRRTRYITSALAVAAAALVVIWAGTTHLSKQGMMGVAPERSASAPMIAERADEAAKTQNEPTTATSEDAAGGDAGNDEAEVRVAVAPAEVVAEAPARTVRRERPPTADVTPAREVEVANDITPAPPAPVAPVAAAPEADTGRGVGSAVAPAVEEIAKPSMMVSRAPGGASGPAEHAMIALAGDEEDGLQRVEPKYFAADATMVARMGPVGDTPFTISVFPPTLREVGKTVPATIIVETERDVERARIRVRGLHSLEIVGASDDGVIYRGPLLANQKTEQSVRIRANEPGNQSMIVNLRSSHPEVETDLVVDLGEFQIEVPPTLKNIEANFKETPINDAIEQIVEASGMQVQVRGELPEQRVTKDFSAGVPAEAALRIVTEDVGWQVRDDEGLQIVEPLPATPGDDN